MMNDDEDLWEDLCKCGHDIEDHNDIWKGSITACHRCACSKWKAVEEAVE